mgnify:CR=1 FL=1
MAAAGSIPALASRRWSAPRRVVGGRPRARARCVASSASSASSSSSSSSSSRRRRAVAVPARALVPAPGSSSSSSSSRALANRAATRPRGRRVVSVRATDDDDDDARDDDRATRRTESLEPSATEDGEFVTATDAAAVEECEDEDEDEYEEIEEYEEVEVDYTPLDHAKDFVESLGTWEDVARWGKSAEDDSSSSSSSKSSSSFAASATNHISSAPGGQLGMAPAAGMAVTIAFVVGALFGRKASERRAAAAAGALADLVARGGGGGGGGGLKVFTEEDRVEDEKRRAKSIADAKAAEEARKKKRDEDEAKFVASEKIRLAKEAEARAEAERAEEARRAKVRAELAERAEIERALREEKEEKERVERERREREAREEQERRRVEEAEARAAEEARRAAERSRRGETSKSFDVTAYVELNFRAARGDVEATVRARAGASSPGAETATFPSSELARQGALRMCSSVARAALTNYASDARVKQMLVEPCAIGVESGGFDEVEFDHWMRVAQARTDAELRTLTMRVGAGLELALRQPNGTSSNRAESREEEVTVTRAALPMSDFDNVSNRLIAAASAAGDNAFAVATEDLEYVSRYELSQLHGLEGGLVFPAVTEKDMDQRRANPLKGVLIATILTLSHWLRRASVAADGGDASLLANCETLAAQILGKVANAEGSSWKAMYLDGFSGDTLSQAAAMTRELLPDGDPVRAILDKAEEEARKKLAGVPTTDEENYPEREESRKARFRADQEAIPLAEKLWAMRNSAAQLSQSGARAQARTMLEEAYMLRVESVKKAREKAATAKGSPPKLTEKLSEVTAALGPPSVAPETLPELLALEECFAGEASWKAELSGVRGQVLKAVRNAAEQAGAAGDWLDAAAILEGAAREYGAKLKLGPENAAVMATREAAEKAWEAAGVEKEDDDAKDEALTKCAGSNVPRGAGGGIVLKLSKRYLKELEARRK